MKLIPNPHDIYGELFERVQNAQLFSDSKTFADAIAKVEPEIVLKRFHKQKLDENFNLMAFVSKNFELPAPIPQSDLALKTQPRPIREQLEILWGDLSREADEVEANSSRLPLPRPYLVPGGRFREIYYWDSYFPMLGLAAAGKTQMIEDMVASFAELIDTIGFVPNGNRSYFCSRSQPPLFAMMVALLAEVLDDKSILGKYLPQLESEYQFWMAGADELGAGVTATRRVVAIDGGLLNRYWDDADTPRPESYLEDVSLAELSSRHGNDLYRDLRAACESGWDFSSRWLRDVNRLETIQTSNVIPVDLNAIMYQFETILAMSSGLTDVDKQQFYLTRAELRLSVLQTRFLSSNHGFFCDLILPGLKHSSHVSLASAYPLFFNIASQSQAASVAKRLEREFLHEGGWVTTLHITGQQWDAPNGWAPLQWIVYNGLRNYGFHDQALKGARRWVDNNLAVYAETGLLYEKYDVENIGQIAAGGEYNVQTGFGWTNGVLLKFLDELKM